jgi:hypothetical protein
MACVWILLVYEVKDSQNLRCNISLVFHHLVLYLISEMRWLNGVYALLI